MRYYSSVETAPGYAPPPSSPERKIKEYTLLISTSISHRVHESVFLWANHCATSLWVSYRRKDEKHGSREESMSGAIDAAYSTDKTKGTTTKLMGGCEERYFSS